jgi:PAS domain S-box-containing protein
MVPVALALIILAKGRFTAAGHIVLLTSTVVVWTVMIFDRHSPLVQLNTIAFIYGAMSMVPLLVVRNKGEVLAYCALNLIMYGLFCAIWLPDMGLTHTEFYDYLFDNLVALLFISIAIYYAFQINQGALDRAEHDIAERKEAQAKLKQLQHLLSNVIDSMPSSLIGLNVAGAITQWNRESETLAGIPSEQALGRPFTYVVPELAYLTEKIEQAIDKVMPIRDERVPLAFDKEIRHYDITVYPLGLDDIDGVVLRVDDISERLRMEETLVQSEKMLSVGGLAAGMAHEINNPLAGILQTVQVVKRRLYGTVAKNSAAASRLGISEQQIADYCSERGIDKMLEALESAGQRAAKIVNNMLGFSRKSRAHFSSQDLVQLLDETCELASSEYDLKKNYDFRNVVIVRDYDSKVPEVICDANQIEQVLFNLITNAAHAMADGAQNRNPRLTLRLAPDGDHVRIVVEDNGPGFDEATRKRVFEPFFTTKEVGVGTGLGLSVSYFIITENHQGTIEVDSSPGRGARFTIRLRKDGPG